MENCLRCDMLNVRLSSLPIDAIRRINEMLGYSRTLPMKALFGLPIGNDLIVSKHEGKTLKNVFNIQDVSAFAMNKNLFAVADTQCNITFYWKYSRCTPMRMFSINIRCIASSMRFHNNKLYYGLTSRIGMYDFETRSNTLSYTSCCASNEVVYAQQIAGPNIIFVSGRNLLRCDLELKTRPEELLRRNYCNKDIVSVVSINGGYIIGETDGTISFVEDNKYNILVPSCKERSYTGLEKNSERYVHIPNMWCVEAPDKFIFIYNNGDIFEVHVDRAIYKGNVGHRVKSVCSDDNVFIAFGEQTTEICFKCI